MKTKDEMYLLVTVFLAGIVAGMNMMKGPRF